MRSARFAIGVMAGVLLAVGVVFALSYAPSSVQPSPSTVSAVVTQSAATTTTFSSTIAAPLFESTVSNATTTVTSSTTTAVYGAQLSAANAAVSNLAAQPPSSVSRILSQPVQSLLFLLPVAVALLLGFLFYRGSTLKT